MVVERSVKIEFYFSTLCSFFFKFSQIISLFNILIGFGFAPGQETIFNIT